MNAPGVYPVVLLTVRPGTFINKECRSPRSVVYGPLLDSKEMKKSMLFANIQWMYADIINSSKKIGIFHLFDSDCIFLLLLEEQRIK